MKLDLEGDTITVQTDAQDKELASALNTLVSGTRDLITTIGAGECEWCDERARLRPYQVTMDGEFTVLQVCPDCQADFVEEAHSDIEGDDDGLTVPDDELEELENQTDA